MKGIALDMTFPSGIYYIKPPHPLDVLIEFFTQQGYEIDHNWVKALRGYMNFKPPTPKGQAPHCKLA